MRKMNDYVRRLEEISEDYPDFVGRHIAVRNNCGFVEIRTITGIFTDPDMKEYALVLLLDDGKHIVRRARELEQEILP
ncbi:MAG: hypothetical protein DRP01_01455 [Archaeoglobales archaeon]|nr:MAG: hypothetical protein DRP01_01455 [Archaeoglobales archaeon]